MCALHSPYFAIHDRTTDYKSEDIDEFIDEYKYDDKTIKAYKRYRKLEDIFDKIAIIGAILSFLSIFALLLIPAYSMTSKFILSLVELPPYISQYVSGTQAMQRSTLMIVAVFAMFGFIIYFVSAKIRNVFQNQRQDKGLSSVNLDYMKISEGYCHLEDDNYPKAIDVLREYEGRYGYIIDEYISAATLSDGVDEEYIESTYEDFFGLFIMKISHSHSNYPDRLDSIVNRYDSEYYEEDREEPKTESYPETYRGILFNAVSSILSSIANLITSFPFDRPYAMYIIILLVGIGLIKISPEIAVIVVTVLMGGFGNWRKRRKSAELEGESEEE